MVYTKASFSSAPVGSLQAWSRLDGGLVPRAACLAGQECLHRIPQLACIRNRTTSFCQAKLSSCLALVVPAQEVLGPALEVVVQCKVTMLMVCATRGVSPCRPHGRACSCAALARRTASSCRRHPPAPRCCLHSAAPSTQTSAKGLLQGWQIDATQAVISLTGQSRNAAS